MAVNMKPRTKDHWTLRLRIKRPGSAASGMLLALAAIQAVLLFLTASSFGRGGGLYGCASPCGTAAQPTTPLLAVLIGIAIFTLPAVIGLYSATWRAAVAMAVLPWWAAVIFTASTMLAAPATFAAGDGRAGASAFPAPFWLDASRALPLLLSLILFAGLGWFGWLVRETLSDA